MSAQTEMLGGRLPLLDPQTLSLAQKQTYDRLNRTWIPWGESIHVQSKTADGRLIGPYNPILFSPVISSSKLRFHSDRCAGNGKGDWAISC
jgi:4-carboxymuconolactone decarboxylase